LKNIDWTKWSAIAEVLSSIAIIVTLLVLVFQTQKNTNYLRRSEINTTMDQASTIRLLSMDREWAELLIRAGQNPESLDPPDRIRVSSYLGQVFWASWQIYDREQGGYVDPGEWERGGKPMVEPFLRSEFGRTWWAQGQDKGMSPEFIDRVNEVLLELQ
jgi:hypothetical protein